MRIRLFSAGNGGSTTPDAAAPGTAKAADKGPACLFVGSGGLPSAVPVLVTAEAGEPISRAVWLSGRVRPLPLCGGLGRCARCRVRYMRRAPLSLPAEEEVFSPQELADGWRLACRRQVPDGPTAVPEGTGEGGLDLELPPENLAAGPEPDVAASLDSGPGRDLALAVDLGTTSVYWRALGPEGRVVGTGTCLNPQAGAGADVMCRLAVARELRGRRLLAALARQSLRAVMEGLEGRGAGRVTRVCLAANTAMTDIFLERPVEGLCAAPYALSHSGHERITLPDFPPVYIPPLPAPFVGGDVSAGLAALLHRDTPRPFILADLGTNGELALMTEQGQLWLTSVPLGPALEGIGPQCGQLAGPGVVTAFSLTPQGLAARFYEEDGAFDALSRHGSGCACPSCRQADPPGGLSSGQESVWTGARGISATGYLSLLAVLLRAGIMDGNGHFVSAPAMPLARRLASAITWGRDGPRLRLPYGLWLAAADVEELLKVKAAFALALERLLAAALLAPADVAALCLAGALGQYASPEDLETLGFVPASLTRRVRAVGNTALDGAALLLSQPEQGAALAHLCARARLLPLVDEVDFHHNYVRHMRFGD